MPLSIRKIISDQEQPCFISVASLWEITIKVQMGKLDLAFNVEDLYRFAERNEMEVVPINEQHLVALLKLEYFHRDPFDRIIVAQAISENLTLLSGDTILKNYPVQYLWN